MRISGLKRVCTEKTMYRTSEVPREGEVKGVNENSLQSHPVTDCFLEAASKELLKLLEPGAISKHSGIQISQRFESGGEEQRKENR